MPITLGELASRFDCELIGDAGVSIDAVGSLENAGPGALSFLASSKFRKQLPATRAAAVICRADDAADAPCAVLVNDNPYACYAKMAATICPPVRYSPGVHASAVVDSTAEVALTAHVAPNAVIEANVVIGERSYIGPGVVVGPDCRIGDDCRLDANATLVRDVKAGDRCVFNSGSVIGADGFGNAMTPDGWVKVPQLGGVCIGNDFEIGAGSTVDCGAIDDTIIGNDVRIDNQVQIGHNVHIGDHTAMAAGVAVAGSARIGNRCMLAGMVGVAGHIEICDDVTVLGKAMVSKSITEPGSYASMFPAEDARDFNRRVASLRRLDKLQQRVKRLEQGNS